MFRVLWVALVALVVTIPSATATLVVAMFSSSSPLIDWIARLWARSLVAVAGIELRTENLASVDPLKRYILVSNHYSYFDIPCIFAAIPQPIRFMAKASLFKIPIFGWSLGRAGFIPIDRKNLRTAVKSFDLAAERIRRGNTIVIFPEEGRTAEIRMRPFQRGAFLLAIKSEKTLLPVAVDGTFNVFRVGARKITPGVVTVRIGRPIDCTGTTLRDKDRLAEETHGQIEAMLGVYGTSELAPHRRKQTEPPEAGS
jgi:1-acyl-sn-glycerol-3-phosphate acyltransferase